MNQDLERLIRALDALSEAIAASDKSLTRELSETYNSLLTAVADAQGISPSALDAAVQLQHKLWIRTQRNPSSLPPKA